jgi:hypothetical protein
MTTNIALVSHYGCRDRGDRVVIVVRLGLDITGALYPRHSSKFVSMISTPTQEDDDLGFLPAD